MRFGVHVSASGGLEKAPDRAAELGCDSFQLFIANPRSWAPPDVNPAQAEAFRARRAALRLDPVVVHITYLVNCASPAPALWKRSAEAMEAQYAASAAIGADLFVIHPGSHKETSVDEGTARIAEAIRRLFDRVPEGPVLLLENTAGGGNTIGRSPEELGALYQAIGAPERTGLCLDTCHAWAMGVDAAAAGGFGRFRDACESATAKDSVRLIHANDSRFPLGEGQDRHQHIGLGRIGEKGFRQILHTRGLRRLPWILETPVDSERGDTDNLAAIRRLAAAKG